MKIGRIIIGTTLFFGVPAGGFFAGRAIVQSYQTEKNLKMPVSNNAPRGMSSLSWYLDHSAYSSKAFKQKTQNHRETLLLGFQKFDGLSILQAGDPHYNNTQRLKLVSDYINLYVITGKDVHLNDAFETIKIGLQEADPALRWHSNPDPEYDYVREYFELKLARADLWLMVGRLDAKEKGYTTAIDLCNEIIKEVQDPDILQAQNIIAESVPGYTGRAQLIMARSMESLGKYPEARALYEKVVEWAKDQTKDDLLTTLRLIYAEGKLWDVRLGIRYIGALAKIQLAFMNISDRQSNPAFDLFDQVLRWEDVGRESGPLDLGFVALIGSMLTCNSFADLPWNTILSYHDMLDALKLDAGMLKLLPPKERAKIIADALRIIPFEEKVKDTLRLVYLRF